MPRGRDWGVERCQTGEEHRGNPPSNMIFLVRKDQGIYLKVDGWALLRYLVPWGCFSFRVLSFCLPHIWKAAPSTATSWWTLSLTEQNDNRREHDMGTVALGTLFTYCHFLRTFLSCLFCLVRPGIVLLPLHRLRILEPEHCGERSTHLTPCFSGIAFKMRRTHKLHSQWQNRKPLVLFPWRPHGHWARGWACSAEGCISEDRRGNYPHSL